MSDSVAMILVVVAVVLVVAIVALVLMRTKGKERRAHQAAELRGEASAKSVDVEQAQRSAASREAAAEQAREEAEIAEARAAEARQELAQAEAQREDTVREADRLDPAVDHKSDDYTPQDVTPPRSGPR
jgi:predicted Holliday junction resolvase-like endonuclease